MRISGGVGGEYKYSGISPAVEYGDSGEEDLEEEYKREKKDQTLSSGRLILYLILPLLFMTCPLFHYCILSYPILSCPFYHYCILSYPILSFLLFHYCILSYPIPSLPLLHSILSYPVLSTIIAFYPILSCPVIFQLPLLHSIISYPVLSTIIAFYSILSCHILSSIIAFYSILSCHILSTIIALYPILSCRILSFSMQFKLSCPRDILARLVLPCRIHAPATFSYLPYFILPQSHHSICAMLLTDRKRSYATSPCELSWIGIRFRFRIQSEWQ